MVFLERVEFNNADEVEGDTENELRASSLKASFTRAANKGMPRWKNGNVDSR